MEIRTLPKAVSFASATMSGVLALNGMLGGCSVGEGNGHTKTPAATESYPGVRAIDGQHFLQTHARAGEVLRQAEPSVVAVVGGESLAARATGFKVAPDKVVTVAAVARDVYEQGCGGAFILYRTLHGRVGRAAIGGVVLSPYGDIAVLTVTSSKAFSELPTAQLAADTKQVDAVLQEGAGVQTISWQAAYLSTSEARPRDPGADDVARRRPVERSAYVLGKTDYGIYYRGPLNGYDVAGGFNGYNGTPDGTAATVGAEGSPVYSTQVADGRVFGIVTDVQPLQPQENQRDYFARTYDRQFTGLGPAFDAMNVSRIRTLNVRLTNELAEAQPLLTCPSEE